MEENHRLEEAIALLIQNQASFLVRISEMDRINSERFAKIDERFVKLDERLAHMEAIWGSVGAAGEVLANDLEPGLRDFDPLNFSLFRGPNLDLDVFGGCLEMI